MIFSRFLSPFCFLQFCAVYNCSELQLKDLWEWRVQFCLYGESSIWYMTKDFTVWCTCKEFSLGPPPKATGWTGDICLCGNYLHPIFSKIFMKIAQNYLRAIRDPLVQIGRDYFYRRVTFHESIGRQQRLLILRIRIGNNQSITSRRANTGLVTGITFD